MADITPKLKLFLFISLLSLLINFCACAVAMIDTNPNINEYGKTTDTEIISGTYQDNTNISITNFALATATSFVPFVDLVNLAFLDLDIFTLLIIGIIVGIVGALKLLLIIAMTTNLLPFFNT
jgi:hypothetical protein